jgi:uncharacterized membrane protein HdeD (DUF308 family)
LRSNAFEDDFIKRLKEVTVMSATTTAGFMRESWGWSIGLSIIMIVAGVLAIALPWAAAIAANILVGWMLVLSSGAHFAFASQGGRKSAVIWEVLLGILYLVVGVYVLINPALGLISLALALAVYLLVEGVLEFILAFRLQPIPGWGWLLFDGIITLILGVMIWRLWPSGAGWVIGTLVGISMLFSGISRLMLSLAARPVIS